MHTEIPLRVSSPFLFLPSLSLKLRDYLCCPASVVLCASKKFLPPSRRHRFTCWAGGDFGEWCGALEEVAENPGKRRCFLCVRRRTTQPPPPSPPTIAINFPTHSRLELLLIILSVQQHTHLLPPPHLYTEQQTNK